MDVRMWDGLDYILRSQFVEGNPHAFGEITIVI